MSSTMLLTKPFSLSNRHVFITGGTNGIGLALAQRFAAASNTQVIVCGRNQDALKKIEMDSGGKIKGWKCDVSNRLEREALAIRIHREFPKCNVLVNNAGIQNRTPDWKVPLDWNALSQEIQINVEAPMHLSNLLIPQLLSTKSEAAIFNISSGLAFAPLSFMPVYCATKAAIHSFCLTLRHQLSNTNIRVFEVAPPAVQTDLGGKGLHTTGVPLKEWTDHAQSCIEKGVEEFGYGFSAAGLATTVEAKKLFEKMNPAKI
jgi:uncharacterized oxidoreductase